MGAVTLGMSPEQTVHGVFGAHKVGRKRRRVLCWYSGGVAPPSGRFSQEIYTYTNTGQQAVVSPLINLWLTGSHKKKVNPLSTVGLG